LDQLKYVGFAAIEDSVRPEAIEALNECHNAGIRVVMITGDHPQTARAVAKSVGIGYEKENPVVITGKEIDVLTDSELFERVSRC